MGNKRQAEKHAIELSQTYTDAKPEKPKAAKRTNAGALYTSWGGDDLNFFFRWSAADMGFRGQKVEPLAETEYGVERKPLPFWDHQTSDSARLARNIGILSERIDRAAARGHEASRAKGKRLALAVRLEGARAKSERPEARPASIGGTRVRTTAERLTESNLLAAKRHGRVARGLAKLAETNPGAIEVLRFTFLPMPTAPEVTAAFGAHFAWLAVHMPRLAKSHAVATEREPVSLETWLLRRIERKDGIVGLVRGDAEEAALAAVKAYEAAAEEPPEVRAERERVDEEVAYRRARRRGPDRQPRMRDEGVPFIVEEGG